MQRDDDARRRWFRAYGLSLIVHALGLFLFVFVLLFWNVELPDQASSTSGDLISIDVAQSPLPTAAATALPEPVPTTAPVPLPAPVRAPAVVPRPRRIVPTPPPRPHERARNVEHAPANPTAPPTAVPTVPPTTEPTSVPTAEPTVLAIVTPVPTAPPTIAPTRAPTAPPTLTPTAAPTIRPTIAPTAAPTQAPTARPTAAPTARATAPSTAAPTAVAVRAPEAAKSPGPGPGSTHAPGATGRGVGSPAPRAAPAKPTGNSGESHTASAAGGAPSPGATENASLNDHLRSLLPHGTVDYTPHRVDLGSRNDFAARVEAAWEAGLAPPPDILAKTFGIIWQKRNSVAADSVTYVFERRTIAGIGVCKAYKVTEHPYVAGPPDLRTNPLADESRRTAPPDISIVTIVPCNENSYEAVEPGSLKTPVPRHPPP